MSHENNYCVWKFIPGTKEPSVFKYNQTSDKGVLLANEMNDTYHDGQHVYYCTQQKYNYGYSSGPIKEDVNLRIKITS